MNTIDILNKHITLCLDIRAKSYHTITLFDALNYIRIGKYRTLIENIRRLYCLGKSAIAVWNRTEEEYEEALKRFDKLLPLGNDIPCTRA